MNEPIAIVGMACRFPKAQNLDEYWQLLAAGTDAVSETPRERWNAESIDAPACSRFVTGWGGFIDHCDKFDAEFFRIGPDEAARIDPQQRLMLEGTWSALEDAGIAPLSLSGARVGVFTGVSHSDYERIMYREIAGITGLEGPGAYHAIIANRVSYFLNLKGPSMVVDTACSSALSALHVAAQALRAGDCDLALVSGVSLNLTPEETMSLSMAHMISPSGRTRAFDDRADGFVRGEGLGVLVLCTAAYAAAEGLRVRAKVLASAINQDGSSNGLMAPNALAQVDLLREALRGSGLSSQQIDYVEAHGTGTAIGDSIEFSALHQVFGAGRAEPLPIGSVKTNIGHLEAASGVASIIKVVLAMEHGVVPRQLHFERANRYIQAEGSGLSICTEPRPWLATDRRAGVSTFGFGGSNAHVILERSAPALSEPRAHPASEVLVLSAKTPQALRRLASALAEHLRSHDVSLEQVCYTMAVGRQHFAVRLALVARDITELRSQLQAWLDTAGDPQPSKTPRLAVWLGGHASSALAVSEGWPASYHAARARCEDAIAAGHELHHLTHAYAYVQMLASWGIRPALILGPGAASNLGKADFPEQLRQSLSAGLALHTTEVTPSDAAEALRVAKCNLLLRSSECTTAAAVSAIEAARQPEELPHMIAELYRADLVFAWKAVYAQRSLLTISLPTYPFERTRHWVSAVNHPDESRFQKASMGTLLADISPPL